MNLRSGYTRHSAVRAQPGWRPDSISNPCILILSHTGLTFCNLVEQPYPKNACNESRNCKYKCNRFAWFALRPVIGKYYDRNNAGYKPTGVGAVGTEQKAPQFANRGVHVAVGSPESVKRAKNK
jgi:hypothetical protein